METNKKKLITHNGSFHADDIFAAATLALLLEARGESFEIIRTRDEEIVKKADYVFDVGGVHDPLSNRFDHHQKGGAGEREGIPYAAFGLVWKKFGAEVSGSQEVANRLEQKFVKGIDANDNGISLFGLKGEVAPLLIQEVFRSFRPSWKEKEDYDTPFLELVEFVKKVIKREIIRMRDSILAEEMIKTIYEKTADKRIVIMDDYYPWEETLENLSEPIFVVYPKADSWRVECVKKLKYSFEVRKKMPAEWAGKRDSELSEITGVPDATFCHNGLFMAVAKSKEGALKLAELALMS